MKLLLFLPAIMLLDACTGPAQDNPAQNNKSGEEISNSQRHNPEMNAAYQIILATDTIPGRLDKETIDGLAEPLRALSAFYAAMGGTNCDGENCELTTALGLGEQGSDKHKALINSYFPDDPVAAVVVSQDCYLRPSGASTFSDFEYLTITAQEDTVKVDYRLMQYDRGGVSHTDGPDVYLLKDGRFSKLKRNLWTHVEQ